MSFFYNLGIPNIQAKQLSDTLISVATYLGTFVSAAEIISSFKVWGRDASLLSNVMKFIISSLSGINGLPWLVD